MPESGRPPRIAVVTEGSPTDPSNWSGTPHGLMTGLAAAGAEPLAVDAKPVGLDRVTALARQPWTWPSTNPALAAAMGWSASLALRRAGRLDGVVNLSSGYRLLTRAPVATFDDMTVAQGAQLPYFGLATVAAAAIGRWQRRQRGAFEAAQACLVGSTWTAESLRRDYGIDEGKIHIVGFGRNLAARDVERDWSVPRFIFIGVDWERKGGPDLMRVFPRLRSEIPTATLDLVGGYEPPPSAGVTAHGRLSLADPAERGRLEELIARATCLVVPSRVEPFGIAYVDAGAAGLPSIGSAAGGVPDVVGGGGLLVPPGDDEALLAALREVSDPARAQALGAIAREHSELFTWKAVALRTLLALAPERPDWYGPAEFLPEIRPPSRS